MPKGRAAAALVAVSALAAMLVLPASAAAADGRRVCQVGDRRLTELSGLAAVGSGYVAVNDGSDQASHRKIFYLGGRCSVTRTISYPSQPQDTEDLGVAPDGTLWVADIGDNGADRSTIGLWRLAPGARKPTLCRLSYPDGAHDAEALLLTPAGLPLVVTKSIGAGVVYAPTEALRAGGVTRLRRLGEVVLPITGTSNPFSLAGRLVITGGAVSPDGRHAVLRTYADAFEFDVSDGDVGQAVIRGKPRQIPLPDEPQGESVTYTTDGTALLTVSEGDKPEIRRYPLPARPAAVQPSPSRSSSPTAASGPAAVARTAVPARRADEAFLSAGALVIGAALLLGAAVLIVVLATRSRR